MEIGTRIAMETHAPEAAVIAWMLGQPGAPVRRVPRLPTGARPDLDWKYLCERAVEHGLAPLFLREARELALKVPAAALVRLEDAAEHCAGRAMKCQFTLYRFLAASARRSLATALLKGSALVGSLYRDPRIRAMDDIDLLVRSRDLALARSVGEEIGLGFGSYQLPAFYYRLIQFAAPLQADLEPLVPLDLHWRLHSPALLLTDRIGRVWKRRRMVSVYGFPTSVLDPADQWLHLATHFWSHWGRTPEPEDTPSPEALVAGPGIAVALKWVVDLVHATSGLARELAPRDLANRADEWCAGAEAVAALVLVRPLLAQLGSAFADDVLSALGSADPTNRRRREESPVLGERVHPALGFRIKALRRLPRWIFPPERYLRATSGIGLGRAGAIALPIIRAAHAARVLVRVALAVAALPVAVLGRRLAARSRAKRSRAARSPARVAEQLREFRAFEVAYAARFALDRSESQSG
jgi:Uncharacterised nucleotidyltransferase